ncbi:MAG: 4-hydroxy-3-methylbut-2-enyl diphosphate reductase [Desulfobacterales bacterium]|nr:4-hydroxy-3-methylbut-2-enyl diphosphate reductase [Desulfobacterales bacterium]
MKIHIAKTAGFCMGVRRAVEMVLDTANRNDMSPLHTFGPLIHNPQVLALLEEKGIPVLNKVPEKGSGTVIIRAHGVPIQTLSQLKSAGFRVIDATCPKVIRVQRIIHKHAEQGYVTIIVGDSDHPEVIGLLSYTNHNGVVVSSLSEFENLPRYNKAIIVAQTTQNTSLFEQINQSVQNNYKNYLIFNTICDSTEKRQAEIKHLSTCSDATIIVGGKNSGNTQRLYEIAKQSGKPAFLIENETELDSGLLKPFREVSITAGASTPNWVIHSVYKRLETIQYERQPRIKSLLFCIMKYLLISNLYLALGAGSLCYTSIYLQGLPYDIKFITMAFLYIFSMQVVNNLTAIKSDHYNHPERAEFYQKYKFPLGITAFFSGLIGLVIAGSLGIIPFIILLVMTILGPVYDVNIIHPKYTKIPYTKIKDIPGSKTLLIALAWGVVTSFLPALFAYNSVTFDTDGIMYLRMVLTTVIMSALVFVRSAFNDIMEMQGDRIVGKETIPIFIGKDQTIRLLKAILASVFGVLWFGSQFGALPSLGFILSIYPLFLLGFIYAYDYKKILPGMKLDFWVESHFIVAGIVTVLWNAIL